MSIKIIGAGLGRTGTMSLKKGLEILGYDKCFHMMELLKHPDRLRFAKELAAKGSTDWNNYFGGYQATVDYPNCLYYRELLKEYPNAKVILTLRDPEAWYESARQTIYRSKIKDFRTWWRWFVNRLRSKEVRRMAPVFKFNSQLIWEQQFQGKFEDKAWAIEVYRKHNEEVKNYVPAKQLLVYKVQDGWKPLCDFLGDPIPKWKFPRSNTRQQFDRRMGRLLG